MTIKLLGTHKQVGLPLFSSRVSCGLFGISDDFIEDYLSLDQKFIKHKEASFFVQAEGDSMGPLIQDKDILIVDRSVPIFHQGIATFFYNNQAICKKYIKQENQIILRSLNPKYKDIIITEDDQLDLFGVVIGLARHLL